MHPYGLAQDFVREVLREQPDNIYRFGRDYFENLAFPVFLDLPGDVGASVLRFCVNERFWQLKCMCEQSDPSCVGQYQMMCGTG